MTSHKQTTGGADYTTGYTYNLSGGLLTETYPSQRVVKNTISANGDLSQVETKPSGGSYANRASNFVYTAAGAVSSMQLGNSKYENTVFNSRLQPIQIGLGTTTTGTSLLKIEYDYGTAANNGNVLKQEITVPGLTPHFVQNYTYDSLNRLASATETYNTSTQTWKQEFSYDRYGNRNFVTGSGHTDTLAGCTTMCNPAFSSTTNKITSTGYTYDGSGNTTADPLSRTFVYDGENKQTSVSNTGGAIGNYSYDGDGKRIKKIDATGGTLFLYDAGGRLVEEVFNAVPVCPPTEKECSIPGPVTTSYVYAGSRLLSTETSAGTNYLTADNLGTPRINSNGSGSVVARHDYMPFGEEIATSQRTSGVGYSGDGVRKKFTGYERDGETGLDFAQARYDSSNLGRFSSPDPLIASAHPINPQTYNRYSYVGNSPLAHTDPSGLTWYTSTDKDGTVHHQWFGKKDKVSDGWQVFMGSLEYFDDNKNHVFLNATGPNGRGKTDWERNGWRIDNTPAMNGTNMGPYDPGGEEVGMHLFLGIEGVVSGFGSIRAVIAEADAAAATAASTGAAQSAAKTAAADLLAAGENPRAVSAAYDVSTGESFIGTSGGSGPPTFNPLMQERINLLNSTGGSRTPWCITNCAEFRAVNKALESGSQLNNLELHTVKTTNGLPAFQRCPNCQVTTAGTRVTSDRP